MAASPTPRPTPASGLPADPLDAALAAWVPRLPLAVAFSGGADSTALLHACAARWPQEVMAIHVHHGLQAAADAFERHATQQCQTLQVPLSCERVDARHSPGESPEDAARRARYRALADAARRIGAAEVLLAQHADDQAETVLLALSRGAGLPGMAGMPARFERHGMPFGRPLLGVRGAALRAWLLARHLDWIEDPSNLDTGFTRNRIRSEVLPVLESALPGFVSRIARSAAHAAQAQDLLDELAAQDLQTCGVPPDIAALQALGRARRANALRAWLRTCHGTAPSAAQLDELLQQIEACRTRGHQIVLKVGSGVVRRDDARLAFTLAPGA